MKLNRTYLFVAISSIALVIVLIIQVNWILQTAKVKEELFNEKANMVLSKTAEALSSDSTTYKNMQICVGGNEIHKIDSLLIHYMKFYNIQLGYFFEVKPGSGTSIVKNPLNNFYTEQQRQQGCYTQCVKDGGGRDESNTGFDLKLVFPDKEEFIREEMGILFITSVILILIVFVMSWRTTFSLMKEKEISEHTTDFLNN